MIDSDLLIDLTPLTKLFTLILLESARKYELPCYYVEYSKQGDIKLFNLTESEINMEISEI